MTRRENTNNLGSIFCPRYMCLFHNNVDRPWLLMLYVPTGVQIHKIHKKKLILNKLSVYFREK